ncbi:unnamed protein product [Lathyrus sativus]|nr:unnamed protein product [Lathyrus sativus]
MNTWSMHPKCKKIMSESWNSSVIGFPIYTLNRKIKILKDNLKSWNTNTFGNIHEILKRVKDNIEAIQFPIDTSGYNDSLMNQERHVQLELELDISY